MFARLVLPLSLLVLASCAARRIPGSEIEDTEDTRAILEVLGLYQQALHKRDPTGLLALVSRDYHDDLGTPTPADDLDRATLEEELPRRLGALSDVKVDLSVRTIDVEGERASAVYYFDSSYRIPAINNPQRADSDLARMDLRREGKSWKIVKGL